MKKGFIKVENTGLNGTKSKSPYLTWEWIVGLLMMSVGSFIHVAVLPFIDLVVLSTATALAICLNTVMAVWYLGEKFLLKYDIPAFSLIIGGSLAIVLWSDYSEKSYTPERIKKLMVSTGTIIFMLIYAIIAVFAII